MARTKTQSPTRQPTTSDQLRILARRATDRQARRHAGVVGHAEATLMGVGFQQGWEAGWRAAERQRGKR